jgi:U3 small nucleolar RNA-associated protein 14
MNIETYIPTQTAKKLLELLKNIQDDENFIIGVLSQLDTDEQRKILIEELENGLDDEGVIILMAGDIADGLEV